MHTMRTLLCVRICPVLKVSVLHPDDGPMNGLNHADILQ